jgi:hypothetical protein
MADESNSASDEHRKDGFAKGLSKAMLRRAVVPLAASAATAITAYLTRKSSELWQEKVLPEVRERGGGRAVAKEALERASERVGGRGSQALSGLAGRLETATDTPRPATAAGKEQEASDGRREEEREERRRRRQQRQRSLDQSGSS